MDFFKKSCKELCEKIVSESIDNVDKLGEFIKAKCKEYKRNDKGEVVLNKEIESLTPLILPLSFKINKLPNNYNAIKLDMTARSNQVTDDDVKDMRLYVEYLEQMYNALIALSKAKPKFFSIFLGLGTRKYYKDAAGKINKQIAKCSKTLAKIHYKAIKNGLQQHCDELCNQLADEKLQSVSDLDAFIQQNLHSHVDEAKEVFQPIYVALRSNSSSPDPQKHTEYMEAIRDALDTLAKPMRIKGAKFHLDIGTKKYYKDAMQKISKNIAEYYSELKDTEAGIFQGLKNGWNYCYLNTALQELFDIPNFRGKVLASIPPKTKDFQELEATKFFFECILGKITDTGRSFDEKRRIMAGYLGFDGSQKNSADTKKNIELKCRNQMRILKEKAAIEPSVSAPQSLDEKERKNIEDQWQKSFGVYFDSQEEIKKIAELTQIMEKLYGDQSFKNKVLKIDVNELNLKEDYINLERVSNIFSLIEQNKEYSGDTLGILQDWLRKGDGQVQEYQQIKLSVLNQINAFERSKKAHILSMDSKVTVVFPQRNVTESLESVFDEQRKDNMAYYLPLKSNRFSIHLSDREHGGVRQQFSVETTLDLKKLVDDKKLKIFVKNKELEKNKCLFRLVSASIGTGVHYYVYKRVGNVWKEINDKNKTNHRLLDIQKDINERCETLTYELI